MSRWIGRVLYCWLLLGLALAGNAPSWADEWRAPENLHWSKNDRYVLKLSESREQLTLKEVKTTGATALWTIPCPQEGWPPHRAFVSDDGRSVVLVDRHGELGAGNVLVFLGERGKVLCAYTLNELFSSSEILNVEHTISSIWWSIPGQFFFLEHDTRFGFITHWGALGLFDVATGNRLTESDPSFATLRQEAVVHARADLKSGDSGRVDTGAALAGVLKMQDAVPDLKKLLTDPSHCQLISAGYRADYYGLQLTAGKSLVQILGKEAAPLIEARFAGANPAMAMAWAELMSKTGQAGYSPGVAKLAKSRDPYARLYAVNAMVETGDPALVRLHPEWLQDRSQDVRYAALRCLAEKGDARDIGQLRKGLGDSDAIVRLWALRGLIRLKAPGIEPVLRRALNSDDPVQAFEARLELAERGDRTQQQWFLNRIARLENSSFQDIGDNMLPLELQAVCKMLARQNPAGTAVALRKAATHLPPVAESPVWGARAALGEGEALEKVRVIARRNPPTSDLEQLRAWNQIPNAIEWLGLCKDHASAPLLRERLHDREETIREAAKTALAAMGEAETAPPPQPPPAPRLGIRTVPGHRTQLTLWLAAGGGGLFLGTAFLCLYARHRKGRAI